VTSRGLLPRLLEDPSLVPASAAITEEPTTIEPGATAEEAVSALSDPAVSHLLVSRHPDSPPQGVVTELDLLVLSARRHR